MSSREKQRKERKTAVEENGRKVKKKKRKNSKPEKYYKDGRIVYKEDRLITSRCNVSSESFTFHLLLDLRFSSFALFHPLLPGESIYIFFPRRCLFAGKERAASSSSFNEFFDRISRRAGGGRRREKWREKRTVSFFFFLSTREFIPRFDGPLC